jgi:hypothetical protein
MGRFTSNQLRAALALLGWTMADLSARSGVGLGTIKNRAMRPGTFDAKQSTVDAIMQAFFRAGVEIRDGGVHPVRRHGAFK